MAFFTGPKVASPEALPKRGEPNDAAARRLTHGSETFEPSQTNSAVTRSASVPLQVNDSPPTPKSLGHWLKQILPSHRPERGGTLRHLHPVDMSEDLPHPGPPQRKRRFSDSQRGRARVAEDSDALTRWNTARDISEDAATRCTPQRNLHRVDASGSDVAGRGRKWSWLPNAIEAESISVEKAGVSLESSPQAVTPESAAAAAAERRISKARRNIADKRRARHERQSLKESGDYLGVQGINPETSELDVISPTDSDISEAHREVEQRIDQLRERLKETRVKDSVAAQDSAHAIDTILSRLDDDQKKTRREHEERLPKHSSVKWRKGTKQWSSVLEPTLSPIAGSRRTTMPVLQTSGASTLPDEPKATSSPGKLIDLTTPAVSRTSEFGGIPVVPKLRLRAPSVGSQNSAHGTVVLSGSALELLENGIRFDDREDEGSLGASPNRQAPGPGRPVGIRAVTSPTGETTTDHPGKVSKVGPSKGPGPWRKVSFLGATKAGRNLTPERSPEPLVNEVSQTVNLTSPQVDPDTSHRPSKVDEMKHRLIKLRKGIESIKNTSPETSNLTTKDSPGARHKEVQFRELRGKSPNSALKVKRSSLQETSPNRGAGPNSRFHLKLQQDGKELPESPQIETSFLGPTWANGRDLAELRLHQDGVHTDQIWIDQTIEDISKCSQATPEIYASTRITTTTGFGLQESISHQAITKGLCARRSEMNPTTSTSHSPTSSEPSWVRLFEKSILSPTETRSSTSLNSDREVNKAEPVIDTISDTEHNSTKGRIFQLKKKVTGLDLSPSDKNTQHTYTSIQLEDQKFLETLGQAGLQEAHVHQKDQQTLQHMRPPLWQTQVQVPGSYLEDPIGEDDIGALFRSLRRSGYGMMLVRLALFLITLAFVSVLKMITLYWSTVQPLISSRSEYWVRRAKREATWADGLALILAAPGAVLITGGIVWLLQTVVAISD